MAQIPPTTYTIQSAVRGWNGDLDSTVLEAAANRQHTEPCACGGAAWVRVWPEPDPRYAHIVGYDVICGTCGCQATATEFWAAESAIRAWNNAQTGVC